MRPTVDAVVVGGGHHGLVAAALLADAGWDVCLFEAAHRVGGAVASEELHLGYVSDLYSAFYPLSHASPVLRELDLEHHGLTWTHAPSVLAHPLRADGDTAAVLHRAPEDTAAGLEEHHPGDGAAWLELHHQWRSIREPFLDLLFTTFPPVRGPLGLLRRLGTAEALRMARFLLLPSRRMGQELFGGEAARLLLAGNAAHADTPLDAPGSGVFGWLLAMLAQDGGYPVPVGGAGELAQALRRRAEHAGAEVRIGERVERIDVAGGRAVGVRTASGTSVRARRAVVVDVSVPSLYRDLLPPHAVPDRLRADLEGFEWDLPSVKVNWALDGPVPWRAAGVAGAGTVHVGADEDGLLRWGTDLETGRLPDTPFMLFGQMTTSDPTRSPAGTESAWAYTHLPRGMRGAAAERAAATIAERVDAALERYAPGFASRVVGRSVQSPEELQAGDANLVDGAVNGGTTQLFQQLVFRPTSGLGRPETVVDGLFLGSAGAHPGGGVHGVCGALAASAALRSQGWTGPVRRRVTAAALRGLYRDRRSAR